MGVDPFGLCGQMIEAQFRVDRVVGEGGFSVVYLGHHLGLNEPVAIKCLKLQGNLDSAMIESFANRFRDESRIAYRLSQGNLDIVRSITAGTTVAPSTGALVPYMVLEFLEGRSLGADFRERRHRGMTGRSLEEIVELFDPAVTAIAYAHAQGVVHRDLKPGNLFLAATRAGVRLKVLDFGLAKIVDDNIGIVPSAQTVGHHTICSPSYGAPEQFDPAVGKIGPWTDVYALGLLILEALRDKKVRSGEGLAQCAVEALMPSRQPTCHSLGIKVRAQVEVALARAVAVDTTTRPADAGQLWDLLKKAVRRAPTSGKNIDLQEMGTVVEPNAHDEVTRAVDGNLADLSATSAQDPGPIPREAFRSQPDSMPLGGTLVMNDAPARPNVLPAAGRAPSRSPRASTLALGDAPGSVSPRAGASLPTPLMPMIPSNRPEARHLLGRHHPEGFAHAASPSAVVHASPSPPPSPRAPSARQSSRGTMLLVIVLFVVAALAVSGYLLYSRGVLKF